MGSEIRQKLCKYDLDRAVNALPEQVKALLISKGKNLCVAGGFLRSLINYEQVKDIDLFSTSKEEALNNFNELSEKVNAKKIKTQNAYSLKSIEGMLVQFIHRWVYPSPIELVDSFDFTIACASFWYDKDLQEWDSCVVDQFYGDCVARVIRFRFPNRIEEPAGSMLRVLKFTRMGYDISNESLSGVITKLVDGIEEKTSAVPTYVPQPAQSTYSKIHQRIGRLTGDS